MKNINKILVVSRMTKNCVEAVQQGVSLARKYDAELFLIHVMHNPFGLEGWNLPMVSLKKDYEKLREEAKADLEKLVASEREKGLRVSELVREGEPDREIITVVNDYKIDLMIMITEIVLVASSMKTAPFRIE